MASKRFCDICEKELSPEDDKPFIRYHPTLNFKVSMIVTDRNGNVETDVCQNCRLLIAVDGITEEPLASIVPRDRERESRPIISSASLKFGGTKPVTEQPIYVPSLSEAKAENSQPDNPQPEEELG